MGQCNAIKLDGSAKRIVGHFDYWPTRCQLWFNPKSITDRFLTAIRSLLIDVRLINVQRVIRLKKDKWLGNSSLSLYTVWVAALILPWPGLTESARSPNKKFVASSRRRSGGGTLLQTPLDVYAYSTYIQRYTAIAADAAAAAADCGVNVGHDDVVMTIMIRRLTAVSNRNGYSPTLL